MKKGYIKKNRISSKSKNIEKELIVLKKVVFRCQQSTLVQTLIFQTQSPKECTKVFHEHVFHLGVIRLDDISVQRGSLFYAP